ncbi:DUF2750 domain-containing protein [Candidatus Odyssella acanthamoebae]|uniref:DUF2750 domain-containing protein n=1 Tax=Candidatus Odyssella acanthamoebae TaxID=91604 RepID=A0A077AWN4_9PROT|nr:DUF2750 domain-containing protein [Candidatus Paracaedibacter acanthamoebae]AIK96886.1 hypothetical protein ID47_09285 [Candidatus Paracaedibacter acanthamoebae]
MNSELDLEKEFNGRALKFIEEAVATEKIYVLVQDKMCVQTESLEFTREDDEPLDTIPLWTESYVENAKTWAEDYATLEEMPVSYLIEEFLPEIEEGYCSVGLNWDQDGIGRELPPFHLVQLLVKQVKEGKITEKDLDISEE